MDIHVRIAKYNKETNFYDELVLYKPGEEYHYDEEGNKIIDNPDFKKVHIYTGRDSEMFDGMKHGDEVDGYGEFPWVPVRLNSLEPSLRADIEDKISKEGHYTGYFDFYELSLADMKLYLHDHPTVADYYVTVEEDEPTPQKDNPIQALYEDIYNYASIADDMIMWENLSSYKVIFYFDW